MDSLLDDYTRSWESEFASAFDEFRKQFALVEEDPERFEAWRSIGCSMAFGRESTAYRAENIQRRHAFFAAKMHERLPLKMKDPQRMFGALEREIIYYRSTTSADGECDADVIWSRPPRFDHVDQHSQGGKTASGERCASPPLTVTRRGRQRPKSLKPSGGGEQPLASAVRLSNPTGQESAEDEPSVSLVGQVKAIRETSPPARHGAGVV